MFKPASLFIGLRYTRAKRRSQFISLISLISICGIALGVIVLITVLSVLNGFDREIKKQIFGLVSPISITSYTGKIEQWEILQNSLEKSSTHILAIAPFINGQALLTHSNMTQPAIVNGVLPIQEKKISSLSSKIIQGNFADLRAGHFGIVLGEELAKNLNVTLGDEIIAATPTASLSVTHITPRFKKFKVVGIFHAGGGAFGFDAKLAYVNLHDAQTLYDLGSAISGFHINIKEIYIAPQIALNLQNTLPPLLRAGNWTEQLGDFFENIRVTKTMMFFIFILIIAIAIFNLISTMMMSVKTKTADIAILRTLGATPKMIMKIFVIQGAAIGLGGVMLGMLMGILLAYHISEISIWIQATFHTQLVSPSVYFVNYLPSELQWPDVWMISTVAWSLSLLASVYPAWRASCTEPVEALHYE